jgi:ABC-type Mn2+/Zn2+ transport system permease subunit
MISGIFVDYWEFCYMVALALIVSVSSFVGGVILSFCYIVVAPSIGLILAGEIKSVVFISVFFSICSTFLGFTIGYIFDMPVNQTICAILCIFLFFYV